MINLLSLLFTLITIFGNYYIPILNDAIVISENNIGEIIIKLFRMRLFYRIIMLYLHLKKIF